MSRKSGVPQNAWVVIVDGEKALYLVNKGDDMDMNLVVRDKEEQDNPKAQDWAANRPGRFNDGPSVQRSSVDDTDWHQLEKERFAKDVADQLYQDAHKWSVQGSDHCRQSPGAKRTAQGTAPGSGEMPASGCGESADQSPT